MTYDEKRNNPVEVTHSRQRHQLDERGYIVVPNVLPVENLDAVITDLWKHLSADPHDRASWYKPKIIHPTGMVEMYHCQSMWNNRQHPAVYGVFSDILETDKLWVSIDRVNFKPPALPRYPEYAQASYIHWDIDVNRYPQIPFGVQGVVALTDTNEDMGGFQCIPELYQELGAWLSRQPVGKKVSRYPDITGYPITQVPLRAGDMIIWRNLLPHGNGRNRSQTLRLAQYITMFPAQEENASERQVRINAWMNNQPLPNPFFPGDPRRVEEQRDRPATLTSLGRKLLGLDGWL